MENIITQDVCEVFLQDLDTNKAYFFGLASKDDVSQKVKQEQIRGGIGNGVIATINSDKEMTVKVSTAIHSDDVLAIQSGTDFANKTITVFDNEQVEIGATETATAGEIAKEITGLTGEVDMYIVDSKGKTFAVKYNSTDKKMKEAAKDGLKGFSLGNCTIIYPVSKQAEVLSMDSKKFPKNYKLQLHTIAYDIENNQVTADIFWIFDKALPDGNFTSNYEAGKNTGDDVTFNIQKPQGKTEYGQYIVAKRA